MFRIPILAAIAALTAIGGDRPTGSFGSLVVRTISNHGINQETSATVSPMRKFPWGILAQELSLRLIVKPCTQNGCRVSMPAGQVFKYHLK